MSINNTIAVLFFIGITLTGPASATMPVHDPLSYATLIQQLSTLKDQLAQMDNQLKAVTGNKGMGNIGIEKQRNYLPADWNSALHLLDQGNPYAELTGCAQNTKKANAILNQEELEALPKELQDHLNANRNNAAIQQALGETAYKKASERMMVLQELVDTVSRTQDAKAAMDLQARIQSEQTMLQNETIKMANLQQLQQAQKITSDVQQNEMRIQTSGLGHFPRLQ